MRGLVLLVGLGACGGTSPTAVCAGNHSGSFDGDDIGTLVATLDEKGNVDVTFSSEASGTLSGGGAVEDDGALSAGTFGLDVNGTLDLDTCESAGTWSQVLLLLSGTWVMSPQ